MKKQYSKPDIIFEDFSLSTSIAGGCETVIDNQARGQCGLPWDRSNIFVEGVSGCTKEVIDGSAEYNGLCYHVPVDTNNLFNSA